MKKLFAILVLTVILAACESQIPDEQINSVEHLPTETAMTENEPAADYVYKAENCEVKIIKYKGTEANVIIPETIDGMPVTAVSEYAFSGKHIKSVTYPKSLKTFNGISNAWDAEVLNLPKSVSEINVQDYKNFNKLCEINITDGGEAYKSIDGVVYTADGKKLILFPQKKQGEFSIPYGVTEIGDFAFYGSEISEINFTETLEKIGENAFENCKLLTSVELPLSLKIISEYAFTDSGLEKVVLNDGIETIERYAFEHTNLEELYLPDSVKEVGDYILGSEANTAISAYTPTEGLEPAEKYRNFSYREETVLNNAIRLGKKRYYYGNRIVFADIDGDKFPEMIKLDDWYNYIYKYSEAYGWQELFVDSDEFQNSVFKIYYDRKNDCHFYLQVHEAVICDYYLCADKITIGNNGKINREKYAESGIFLPVGYYYDNYGYVTNFEGGGDFEIAEFGENMDEFAAFKKFVENSLTEYEPVIDFSFYEILNKYNEKYPKPIDGNYIFIDGEFAEKPQKSKYNLTAPEKKTLVTIGDEKYTEDTTEVRLENNEISQENFEKLTQLPKLTSLYLFGDDTVIDLTGINKLTNLKSLYIGADGVMGTESLKNATTIEWLGVRTEDISFLADMDSVRVLGLGNTMDKPYNYYAPAYDMKSLQYIPVSVWDNNITEEQVADIEANRPDVNLCFFKVG